MSKFVFSPFYGSGDQLAASTALQTVVNPNGKGADAVCFTNFGPSTIYFRVSPKSPGSPFDFPVLPSTQAIIAKGLDITTIQFSTVSGTATFQYIFGSFV